MSAAAETIGERATTSSPQTSPTTARIQQFVDQDFDVIVTVGFLIGTDTAIAAKANPDVTFIGVDQGICVDEQGVPDPTFTCAGDAAALIPNYQGIVFAEAQPGYLAGIVAGSLTESGTIGAVGGTNVPAVVNYWRGYENGAKSVNPDVRSSTRRPTPTRPRASTTRPRAGRSPSSSSARTPTSCSRSPASPARASSRPSAMRTSTASVSTSTRPVSLPNLAPCIVTSAEKKLVDTVQAVIQSVANGTFVAGTVPYNAASTRRPSASRRTTTTLR